LNGEFRITSDAGLIQPATNTIDLGDSTHYFNIINYKTLTDRGCLGWADEGVQLQTGEWVSDLEALLTIKKHPTKMTITGMPMIDYRTFPKPVYRPSGLKKRPGFTYFRDKNDEPWAIDREGNTVKSEDGAELTSLVSIMLGAIKELNQKIEGLK